MPSAERIDTLDVLRGFALLGILLVNIELFRGADLYRMMLGEAPERSQSDRIIEFLVGWLVSGKFISSFAILFGIGAAIIVGRVTARGGSPRSLLARRYAWLMVFGLAHMLLLFPGDILFLYGLTGMLLLAFVTLRARTALWWSVGILTFYLLITLGSTLIAVVTADLFEPAADDPAIGAFESFIEDRRDEAVEAFTVGGPGEQLRARAWASLFIQGGSLFLLPWVLALFLIGFATWRSGALEDPERRRRLFSRAAAIGIPVGLVANLPLAFVGTLGAAVVGADAQVEGWMLLGSIAQTVGAPVLAIGYLGALGAFLERPGRRVKLAPLRDAGRMALSSYLLQSVLCVAFFTGLRTYDELSMTSALVVVLGVWAVMLAAARLTLRRFERGPVEHLWRRLTYGRS